MNSKYDEDSNAQYTSHQWPTLLHSIRSRNGCGWWDVVVVDMHEQYHNGKAWTKQEKQKKKSSNLTHEEKARLSVLE